MAYTYIDKSGKSQRLTLAATHYRLDHFDKDYNVIKSEKRPLPNFAPDTDWIQMCFASVSVVPNAVGCALVRVLERGFVHTVDVRYR